MKNIKIVLYCLFLFATMPFLSGQEAQIVSTAPVNAETLFSCAGFYASNDGGSFTGSMGEVLVNEMSNTQYSLSNGFQQPYYEISTKIFDSTIAGLEINVSPNPFFDRLTISVMNQSAQNLTLTLTDSNGCTKLHASFIQKEKHLNIGYFPPGIYFLTVFQNNTLIKSVKIMKQ